VPGGLRHSSVTSDLSNRGTLIQHLVALGKRSDHLPFGMSLGGWSFSSLSLLEAQLTDRVG
jgi:hypothetical protein